MRGRLQVAMLGLYLHASGAHAQASSPTPPSAPSTPGAPEGPPPTTGSSEGPQGPTQREGRSALDLSPRAAAQAVLKTDGEYDAPPPPEAEGTLAERLPSLVRSADALAQQRLERAAEDAIWQVLRPWEMRLRKGRYWYMGRGFDAAILGDGTIEYRSKDGLTLSFVPIMERKGFPTKSEQDGSGRSVANGASIPGFGIGIADPGSALSRRLTGQDFHMHERREFLKKTEALREHLADLSMQRKRLTAEVLLIDTLRKLWRRSGVPLSKAQQATFAIWDACSADALGDAARKSIEAFIRELASERAECPFSPAALEAFNRRRKSTQPFEPCAAPPD